MVIMSISVGFIPPNILPPFTLFFFSSFHPMYFIDTTFYSVLHLNKNDNHFSNDIVGLSKQGLTMSRIIDISIKETRQKKVMK